MVLHDGVVFITNGVADAKELAAVCVPLRGEVAGGDDDATRLVAAAEGGGVFGEGTPGFAEVIRAGIIEGKEDITAGEQELLHGHDNTGRIARNGASAGMHPAGFAIVTFKHGLEFQRER